MHITWHLMAKGQTLRDVRFRVPFSDTIHGFSCEAVMDLSVWHSGQRQRDGNKLGPAEELASFRKWPHGG